MTKDKAQETNVIREKCLRKFKQLEGRSPTEAQAYKTGTLDTSKEKHVPNFPLK